MLEDYWLFNFSSIKISNIVNKHALILSAVRGSSSIAKSSKKYAARSNIKLCIMITPRALAQKVMGYCLFQLEIFLKRTLPGLISCYQILRIIAQVPDIVGQLNDNLNFLFLSCVIPLFVMNLNTYLYV